MQEIYSYDDLFSFAEKVFLKMGCFVSDANEAATSLLRADLRGVDSHGVARLIGYVRLWEAGRINATAEPKILHESASTATIDGGSGLGLTVAPYAMRVAIEKAMIAGTGWVSVQNSNHFGIAGHHAMMALSHDMIGIAMTNASAIVAPTFSTEKLLGTNPIAVAIPAGEEPAFVADFATTTAANGKLENLQRKNEPAPLGWLQDAEGNTTTDSHALKNGGALLPLGGTREQSSHKGFMLGSIVDIFSGVLSGANYGPWVPPFPAYIPMPENMPGKGIGHFFGAMRIDAFRPAEDFKKDMDQWITRFKSSKTTTESGTVIIPGEPEAAMEKLGKQNGIKLLPAVIKDLSELGEKMGVKFAELKR